MLVKDIEWKEYGHTMWLRSDILQRSDGSYVQAFKTKPQIVDDMGPYSASLCPAGKMTTVKRGELQGLMYFVDGSEERYHLDALDLLCLIVDAVPFTEGVSP